MPNYDLIAINGVSIPDVKKGTLVIAKNPKYTEHETEDGGKIIDVVEEDMIRGSVEYSGLLQNQISAINAALTLVSTLSIYNPMTGSVKTFEALIVPGEMQKTIHDDRANAWSFGFTFEEIGSIT